MQTRVKLYILCFNETNGRKDLDQSKITPCPRVVKIIKLT